MAATRSNLEERSSCIEMKMTAKSIIDRVLSELPAVSFWVGETALPSYGGENLAHYVMGTQEPWQERTAGRVDFLLRRGLLAVHRISAVAPNTPDEWADLVRQAQEHARALLNESLDPDIRGQVARFISPTRLHESPGQTRQRVWLALVMFNLGKRGLRVEESGVVLANDGTFGAQIGGAPDHALVTAKERDTCRFYAATYVHRVRGTDESGRYPVELARGRGRMRWYVHEVQLDPRVKSFLEIEPEPVRRRIALVVACEEHATRPALPRDYYRDPEFQQAVIDAEDGRFDMTLVLSPRYHVVALDRVVYDDRTWDDLRWAGPVIWAMDTLDRLWRMCLQPKTSPLEEHPPEERTGTSWSVWRHPESRYAFTIFGQSEATYFLAEYLQGYAEVDIRPGYVTGQEEPWQMSLSILEELGLNENLQEELKATLAEATEQAVEFAEVFFIPSPLGLDMKPRALAPGQALEPVMVLRTRDCNVDRVIDEASGLQVLLGDKVNFNLLIDAPARLSAILRIIHAVLHGHEEEVLPLSERVLPPNLQTVVRDRSLPPDDGRLCPLLSFAEGLSALATLLDDDDRDRLSMWLRTFLAAELRHRAQRG
jgi:hypothetical protein